MIIYNQAHTERVEYMLDKLGIRDIPYGKTFRDVVAALVFRTLQPMPGPK